MAEKGAENEGVGPGRPEFVVTPELREKVERYAAGGMPKKDIAAALGCSVPTLNKYFDAEVTFGPARQRANVIDWMFEGAKGGNASLQKRLEEITARTCAQASFSGDQPAKPVPTVRRGKKELADEEAQTAGQGTPWGSDLMTPPAKTH